MADLYDLRPDHVNKLPISLYLAYVDNVPGGITCIIRITTASCSYACVIVIREIINTSAIILFLKNHLAYKVMSSAMSS